MRAKSSHAGQLETPCIVSSIFKRSVLMALFALAIVCFAQPGYSQGTLGTLTPLYIFTNGDGSITPYQSGQMLGVGLIYDMTATPDAGYQFSSWEPVNIFITTQTNYDAEGDPILPPLQFIDPSVVPTNIYGADLEFTMQDVMEVSPAGSNPNIIEAFGWQANFVPVPEPADVVIVGCGLAVMVAVRCRQRYSQKPWRSELKI
jgi:hypothetical protein